MMPSDLYFGADRIGPVVIVAVRSFLCITGFNDEEEDKRRFRLQNWLMETGRNRMACYRKVFDDVWLYDEVLQTH